MCYTTTTCTYCKIEKAWLDNYKIDYKQVFVNLDQKAGEEIVRKTGQMGVPVTEIIYEDNEPDYVIGFDRVQLSQILGVK
jgi:glutaredoxin